MPPTRSLTPLPRRLLRDDVHDRLRDALVSGELEPGRQLRDQELAVWLGVSRTPVREALLRLEQAGLVRSTPGRSTIVTEPDPRALLDAQAVVAAMHRLAVEQSAGRMTADDLAEMRAAHVDFAEAVAAGDVEAALEADDRLHAVPVRVADNAVLSTVLAEQLPLLRRAERQRFGSLAGRESVARHGDLVDHLERGDTEAAAATELATWRALTHLTDLETPATQETA